MAQPLNSSSPTKRGKQARHVNSFSAALREEEASMFFPEEATQNNINNIDGSIIIDDAEEDNRSHDTHFAYAASSAIDAYEARRDQALQYSVELNRPDFHTDNLSLTSPDDFLFYHPQRPTYIDPQISPYFAQNSQGPPKLLATNPKPSKFPGSRKPRGGITATAKHYENVLGIRPGSYGSTTSGPTTGTSAPRSSVKRELRVLRDLLDVRMKGYEGLLNLSSHANESTMEERTWTEVELSAEVADEALEIESMVDQMGQVNTVQTEGQHAAETASTAVDALQTLQAIEAWERRQRQKLHLKSKMMMENIRDKVVEKEKET